MSGEATIVAACASLAKKLLGRTLEGDGWELLGRYVATSVGAGRYHVTVNRHDPPRLRHVELGQALVIPWATMETDFASVPEAVQHVAANSKILHLDPRAYELPALLHDALYAAGWCWAVWQGRAVRVEVTKAQADSVLYQALRCANATVADALAYYGAVSVFGGRPWRDWRRNPPEWPALYREG